MTLTTNKGTGSFGQLNIFGNAHNIYFGNSNFNTYAIATDKKARLAYITMIALAFISIVGLIPLYIWANRNKIQFLTIHTIDKNGNKGREYYLVDNFNPEEKAFLRGNNQSPNFRLDTISYLFWRTTTIKLSPNSDSKQASSPTSQG